MSEVVELIQMNETAINLSQVNKNRTNLSYFKMNSVNECRESILK